MKRVGGICIVLSTLARIEWPSRPNVCAVWAAIKKMNLYDWSAHPAHLPQLAKGTSVAVKNSSMYPTPCVVSAIQPNPDSGSTNINTGRCTPEDDSNDTLLSVVPTKRLIPLHRTVPTAPQSIVCFSTTHFRSLCKYEITNRDTVMEIGASFGECTKTLSNVAKSVVALDVSKEGCARVGSMNLKNTAVHCMNAFFEQEEITALYQTSQCNVVCLDIGGDRDLPSVVNVLAWVAATLKPDIIITKSESLHPHITASQQAFVPLLQTQCDNWAENRPKRAPLIYSPGICSPRVPICKDCNYSPAGCINTDCHHDHDHCHKCLVEGHAARDCTAAAFGW